MKKIIYSLSAIALLSLSAQAGTIRAGLIKSGDIDVTVENVDDSSEKYTGTYKDGQDGWEISYVGGVDPEEGFDYRSAFTFQSVSMDDVSSMTILGEFEFAYNVNKYLSPFVGFNAGLGYIDFDNKAIDNTIHYQYGLFLGLSGEIYNGFGYYAKYGFVNQKGYWHKLEGFGSDIDVITTEESSPLRFGVSYTF